MKRFTDDQRRFYFNTGSVNGLSGKEGVITGVDGLIFSDDRRGRYASGLS